MESLESRLQLALNEHGVTSEHQDSIKDYLDLLGRKDLITKEHSIRVALLGTRICQFMHLDPKVLLFAGSLHDVGKVLTPPETLKKTEGFNGKDMELIRRHPEDTYRLLRGVHEFSAEVALRHHRYQENCYPQKLPKPKVPFSSGTSASINFYARLLSLADFYDAITSRVNDKFGEKKKMSPEEAKAILLMKNPDQKHLINELYANKIFGEDEPLPIKNPTAQEVLYDSVWKDWDGQRNQREIRRQVVLACALEPLSEKSGCTTRSTDSSKFLKLEYLVAAAINIGDAFEELAQRTLNAGALPPLVYDLAYQAQVEGKRNREGGRINQGMIEILIPIVTAQCLYDTNYKLSVGQLLDKATEVLQHTSSADVQKLREMKQLANQLCEYYDREVPDYPETQNVYDYYRADLEHSVKPTSTQHNREFVESFPAIRKMYQSIVSSNRRIFNRKVEDAYALIKTTEHKEASPGLTADCAAVAIYLVLSHHPKEKIIA